MPGSPRPPATERFASGICGAACRWAGRCAGRTDLTGLEIVTVDGPRTREVDDGLSHEILPGTRWRLGVHIADPGAFVDPGSIVDVEALSRATTHYLPEMRLPMLPPSVSEQAASLLAGEDRPGLSFLVVVDREGEIESFEVVRSVLRASARLDYDGADRAIGTGHGTFAALLRDLAPPTPARSKQ